MPLVLIRHGPPRVQRGVPAARWALAPTAEDDDYERTATRYLRGIPQEGWEPVAEVRGRMAAATGDLPAQTIVVGHGLAMSLLVASLHDVDVVSFWRELEMPDAWEVGPDSCRRLAQL